MARLYSNENFPLPVVEALRRRGHDVLTTLEAGQANRGIPDDEVLRFATAELALVCLVETGCPCGQSHLAGCSPLDAALNFVHQPMDFADVGHPEHPT